MDVLLMEASALLMGLHLAEELGIFSIVIESDYMEIVQANLNPSEYCASGAVVTDDCWKLMSMFGRATIIHCVREANISAHELARFGFVGRTGEVWHEDAPDFLIPSLVTDMIII